MREMARKKSPPSPTAKNAAEAADGSTLGSFDEGSAVFTQGDPANALFKVQKGKIKLTVVSNTGKEAVIAVLGEGDFFGEGCLAGQQLRMSTATALTECSIVRMEVAAVIEKLQK